MNSPMAYRYTCQRFRVNPFRAAEPFPIRNRSNLVPKNGFPVVKGLRSPPPITQKTFRPKKRAVTPLSKHLCVNLVMLRSVPLLLQPAISHKAGIHGNIATTQQVARSASDKNSEPPPRSNVWDIG